jgi:hypothetical protein
MEGFSASSCFFFAQGFWKVICEIHAVKVLTHGVFYCLKLDFSLLLTAVGSLLEWATPERWSSRFGAL